MLTAIFSALGGSLLSGFFDTIKGIGHDLATKKISEVEADAKIKQSFFSMLGQVETSHADALTKTYASFMDAAKQSPILQAGWAAALGSQLWVLFWYQWVVPWGEYAGWWHSYPSPGSTVEWAYALIGGLVGLGPVVLRTGPAAGYTSRLKALMGG